MTGPVFVVCIDVCVFVFGCVQVCFVCVWGGGGCIWICVCLCI